MSVILYNILHKIYFELKSTYSFQVLARLKVSITRQNTIIMVAFYIMLARPVGRFWADNDRIETLISLYHGNECLRNSRCSDYKNSQQWRNVCKYIFWDFTGDLYGPYIRPVYTGELSDTCTYGP